MPTRQLIVAFYRSATSVVCETFAADSKRALCEHFGLAELQWHIARYDARAPESRRSPEEQPHADGAGCAHHVEGSLHRFAIDAGSAGLPEGFEEATYHLAAAWRINQELFADPDDPHHSASVGIAIVEPDGQVTDRDGQFESLVPLARRKGRPSLPFSLDLSDRLFEHGCVYRGTFIEVRRLGPRLRLAAREDRRKSQMTPREWQFASAIASGKTYRQIAEELGVSVSTVSSQAQNVFSKTGTERRGDLVAWVNRQAIPLD